MKKIFDKIVYIKELDTKKTTKSQNQGMSIVAASIERGMGREHVQNDLNIIVTFVV